MLQHLNGGAEALWPRNDLNAASSAAAVSSSSELVAADSADVEPPVNDEPAAHVTAVVAEEPGPDNVQDDVIDEEQLQAEQLADGGSDADELPLQSGTDAEVTLWAEALEGAKTADGSSADNEKDHDMLFASTASSPAEEQEVEEPLQPGPALETVSDAGEPAAGDEETAEKNHREDARAAESAQLDDVRADESVAVAAAADINDPTEEAAGPEVAEDGSTVSAAGPAAQPAGDQREAGSPCKDLSEAMNDDVTGDEADKEVAAGESAPAWRRAHDEAGDTTGKLHLFRNEGAVPSTDEESMGPGYSQGHSDTAEATEDSFDDTAVILPEASAQVATESSPLTLHQAADDRAAQETTAEQGSVDEQGDGKEEDGERATEDVPNEVPAGESDDSVREE